MVVDNQTLVPFRIEQQFLEEDILGAALLVRIDLYLEPVVRVDEDNVAASGQFQSVVEPSPSPGNSLLPR